MSDLTERLRHDLTDPHIYAFDCPVCGKHRHELAHEAADALEAAEAKLAAIDALHQPEMEPGLHGTWCHACDATVPWPCPTHRILHPEEEQ